ncbi:MAG: metallopeptidase TldD-related protein [Candidatus Heimdallarchaeota archaeon]|nr:metallopeptidase TldD-related protein [Candidatus Heimdallarchaeota archaeon]
MSLEEFNLNTFDEVKSLVDRINWVSSYEIFLQNSNILTSLIKQNQELSSENISRSGVALRLISTSKRLKEVSFNIGATQKLKELTEPHSTSKQLLINQFPGLKQPKSKLVKGDTSNSVSLNSDLIWDLSNNIDISNFDRIEFEFDIRIEKENLIIYNTGSSILNYTSLKNQVSITGNSMDHVNPVFVTRSLLSRNLNFTFNNILAEIERNIGYLNNTSLDLSNFSNPSIVIHPNVLAKIIAFYYQNFMDNQNQMEKLDLLWSEDLNLYDDPTKIFGYNSCLFDDEGTLTSPKKLIENGVSTGGLSDLSSTDWIEGGNGFRSEWYQPIDHSYTYPVVPIFSNLILDGGMGKGEKFVDQSGVTIVVNNGNTTITGNQIDPRFLIHGSEIQVWKNGSIIGKMNNLTISGNINKLLTNGLLSSDDYCVRPISVPGTVYTGWLFIESDILILS